MAEDVLALCSPSEVYDEMDYDSLFYFQTAYDEGSAIASNQTVKRSWLRKQDKDLQKLIVAYAEGFAGNPKNVSKPKSKLQSLKSVGEFLIRVALLYIIFKLVMGLFPSSSQQPGTGSKWQPGGGSK